LIAFLVAALALGSAGQAALTTPEPCSPSVEWVRPRDDEVLTLGAWLEVEVRPCGNDAPSSVKFFTDDRPIGEAGAPPYRIQWMREDRAGKATLRAVARWDDGSTASSERRTLIARFVTEERVEIVNVYATIRSRRGVYVKGLSRANFKVFEDDAEQTVTNFGVEDLDLSVAFVLDTSYSMKGRKLDTARVALARIVEEMSFPRDRAMVVAIHGVPVLLVGWTRNESTLLAGLDNLEAHGNTALYDSILVAAEAFGPRDGRKVIVVLSDGFDINMDGKVPRPGSVYTFDQVLDYTKRADAMVYCVGLGRNLDNFYDIFAGRSLATVLRVFAEETGGRAFFASRVTKLEAAFAQVVDDLRHQYSLGYRSSNPRRDGAWRTIRVEAPGQKKKHRINHRPGYYAPGPVSTPQGDPVPTAPLQY
jgi:Ca-activated chloride channel family protein